MKNSKPLFLFIVLFILYLMPILVFGENSYVPIHDTLDSEVPWRVVLAHSGKGLDFSSDAVIEQVMNGIPRACFPSGLNATVWLYFIFAPFMAYLINYLIVHTVAFIGMYLLLKHHLLKETDDGWVIPAVSFCFAILPFSAFYGLSIAGQPLLLFSFLNLLRKRAGAYDVILFLLFPFYYSFPHVGPFIICALLLIFVHSWYSEKKPNVKALLCIVMFTLVSLFVENGLIRLMLSADFTSQRAAWGGSGLGFTGAVAESVSMFFDGNPAAAASFHQTYIMIAAVIAVTAGFFLRTDIRRLLILIGICFLISLWYGFSGWDALNTLRDNIPILRSFQWNRFYWLAPAAWYLIFALSLSAVRRMRYGNIAAVLLVALQINTLVINSDAQSQLEQSFRAVRGESVSLITYKRFFSERLFSRISRYIGKPQRSYRIVSIGLHPAVAQYNGFYTLDSYQNVYPLVYKVMFRRIIAKELDKSRRWKEYFDGWGDRCYVFSAELKSMYVRKKSGIKIRNLQLNTGALREMGGGYVLSAAEILNHEQNQLSYLGKFEDAGSPWEIYLYRVK